MVAMPPSPGSSKRTAKSKKAVADVEIMSSDSNGVSVVTLLTA
jgi:hypothetical protein